LAEKYPAKQLLPAELQARAEVYRWLLFTATELEQPLWRIARHTTLYAPAERLPADIPLARRDFEAMARVMEAHMKSRQFLVGDRATVADFIAAYTLDWANELKLLHATPSLREYMERMYTRPKAPPRIAEAMASLKHAG
jgi:glutathione S-transferase